MLQDDSPHQEMMRHVASCGTAVSTDPFQSQTAQCVQALVPKSDNGDGDMGMAPSRGASLTASSQAANAPAAVSASLGMWPTSLNRTGYCNQLYEAEAPDSEAHQLDNIDSNQPHVISNASAPTNGNNTHKQIFTAQHAASTHAVQAQTASPDTQQHGGSMVLCDDATGKFCCAWLSSSLLELFAFICGHHC